MAFRPRAPRRKVRKARKVAKKVRRAKRGVRAPRRLGGAMRVKNVSGQMSFSSARHIHRADSRVRMMERIGAVNQEVIQNAVQLEANAGVQGTGSFAHFDVDQLKTILNNISQTRPGRVVVESLLNEYTMSNFTNSPLELDIYDLSLIRDIYSGYAFDTTTGTYTPSTTPEGYWQEGLNAQRGISSGLLSQQLIGFNPTDSQLFKDWFKINKKTTVLMPIAGIHRHMVSVKANRLVDSLIVGNGETVAALRGITSYVMLVYRGLPVQNITNVTSGPSQLGVVAVQRAKYTFVQDFSYTTNALQNLPTPSSTTTTAWNAGSGAINTITGLTALP